MKSFPSSNLKSQNNQGFGRAFWSSLPDTRGQAIVEYLLIAVVVVVLLGGLSVALFKPLGDFIQGLNQTYIQCLLETGELPTLRSANPSILCADQFPTYNATTMDGQPITPGQGGPGAGGNSPRENQTNADTAGGGGSSAGGVNASAYNRKSSLIRNGMRGVGNARTDNAGDKTTTIPVDEFNEGSGFFGSSSGGGGRGGRRTKSRQIAVSSLTEFDRKKVEREAQKVSTLPMDNESFTQAPKKKFTVKPPPEKVKDKEIEVGGNFGFYFKIFFLIILFLFILILFGGQAMQLSKNWGD